MPFVKTTKTNAYFKRFQTQFRRRHEHKTDYYARKRMIVQDLNKYGTQKYRLVTRITNSRVIAQVIYATTKGDFCIAQAHSQELKKWGLTTGFTSYASAYATGLLVARRLLTKLGMADMFKGVAGEQVDGKDYDVSADANVVKLSRRPFKAILDIGLVRSTIGNRVFGVLKGACDGGLHVPHNVKKFPGYEKAEGGQKAMYHAEAHRDRIFGCHIDEYMEKLKNSSETEYKRQFSQWDACLKKTKQESVEDLFIAIHKGIRESPAYKKTTHSKKQVNYTDKAKTIIKTAKGIYRRDRKLTYAQRKANLQQKLQIAGMA